MSKDAEIYAAAIVSAWQHGEPDGLLLVALYVACGMSQEAAQVEVMAMREMGGE